MANPMEVAGVYHIYSTYYLGSKQLIKLWVYVSRSLFRMAMGLLVVRILSSLGHILYTPRVLCVHHVGVQSGHCGPGHSEHKIVR